MRRIIIRRSDIGVQHNAVYGLFAKPSWLRQQELRWRCIFGRRFSWYDERCDCGRNVFSIISEFSIK